MGIWETVLFVSGLAVILASSAAVIWGSHPIISHLTVFMSELPELIGGELSFRVAD